MSKALIIKLILYYSAMNGMNGNTMLAVAKIESGLNPNAIGAQHEVGLFQVKPQYSLYSKAELLDPVCNIREGIRLLKLAKENCPHKNGNEFLICYNYGINNARKVKHPELWPYVKKVNLTMREL